MATESSKHGERQPITYARASLWMPFHAVGMAIRVRGDVPEERARAALHKLQTLYPPLASRVVVEENGCAWLTTDGVGEFQLDARPRSSDDDWARVCLEQEQVPFAFECGPVTRFVLLRGNGVSELIAILPHVVADGYAMTQVMWDAAALLNDPERPVARPAPPPPVSWQTMPAGGWNIVLLRELARALNHIWRSRGITIDQERYEELHRQYWTGQQNGLTALTLSPAEVADLVSRCRQHGVSVTGALTAAFLLAQGEARGERRAGRCVVAVAVNVRDRLVEPPGRVAGVYASSLDVTLHRRPGATFWELASEGHRRIHRALDGGNQVARTLALEELDPRIADAVVAAIAAGRSERDFGLLGPFINARDGARHLDISNIGRLDLPDAGAPYRLETLLPFPPLIPGGRLALNVLTVNGQMHLILKYEQSQLDPSTFAQLKERALSYLVDSDDRTGGRPLPCAGD